jgi:transposase
MESDNNELPVLTFLQKIKDGLVCTKDIKKEARQQCVDVLYNDGYSTPQIAQIFAKSEKTIKRDLEEICARNSLSISTEFVKRVAGEVWQKASMHHSSLVRCARNKDASITEKVQAELAAWRVFDEAVGRLQTLGYLPVRPQQTMDNLIYYQEGGDVKTYIQLRQELSEIERIAQETGSLDDETIASIKLLEQRIEHADIAQTVSDLEKTKNNNTNKESKNEYNTKRSQ